MFRVIAVIKNINKLTKGNKYGSEWIARNKRIESSFRSQHVDICFVQNVHCDSPWQFIFILPVELYNRFSQKNNINSRGKQEREGINPRQYFMKNVFSKPDDFQFKLRAIEHRLSPNQHDVRGKLRFKVSLPDVLQFTSIGALLCFLQQQNNYHQINKKQPQEIQFIELSEAVINIQALMKNQQCLHYCGMNETKRSHQINFISIIFKAFLALRALSQLPILINFLQHALQSLVLPRQNAKPAIATLHISRQKQFR